MAKKNLKVNITADASGLQKETKKAQSSVQRFTSAATKSLTRVAAGFASIGMVIKGLSSAFRTISEFQSANSKLAAVLGTTTKSIKGLTDAALDLGRRTMYTASQVTELQTELAKLGFNESEIRAMQEPVLKFAAAVGTDLASAAARAGATMRGFGLTAEETGEMLATMAVSTSKSALSFGYLDESLGKLVPVTKSVGLDVKATISLLGTLANAGIDSSSATTALRNTVIELANAESKLSKEIGSQPRTMDELLKALANLRDRNLSVAEASDLVGKRAAPAFLALINGAESCKTLYTELQNVNTELDRMYETMTNNVEGSVNKLKSAWEGFVLSLKESEGPLKWVVDRLTDLVQLMALGVSGYKSAKIDEKIEAKKREWQDAGMTPEEMQTEVEYRQNRIDRAKERGASRKEIKALVEEMLIAFNAMQGLTKEPPITGGTGGGGGGGKGNPAGPAATEKRDWAKEAREYATELAQIQEYDDEMSDVAAEMYDEFKRLHPEIDATTEGIVNFGLQAVMAFEKAERANAEMVEEYERQAQIMEQVSEDLTQMIRGAFSDLAINMGSFLGDAMTGDMDAAAADLKAGMLNTLGDLAQQVGELAISTGMAVAGIKASLESMNPYVAIAAGAALVALGAAVKTAAGNISRGASYGTGVSTSSYISQGTGDYTAREIQIKVTGRLIGQGSTLIGVIDSENNRVEHTT
jgi:TP901 family phage tail tape measure protein